MIFLFRFYWAEAFGIWSDMDHYIYMVLFGILSELSHFGICNDGLLHPANNPILFPALKSASLKNAILGHSYILLYTSIWCLALVCFWEGLDMLIHSSYKFDSYIIFHTSDLFQILVLCSSRNCYFPLMLSAADVFFFQYCLWWKWALM